MTDPELIDALTGIADTIAALGRIAIATTIAVWLILLWGGRR